MMNKKLFTAAALIGLGFSSLGTARAQNLRPVITAVPSLQISPDARAAGMGDVGVSTSADPYAQFWNPAKYAYMDGKAGLGFSYTPWLAKLVNDIALMELIGYYKPGGDDNQAVSASLRYFTMGKIDMFNDMGNNMGEAHPNEFAIDVAYSRQLSESYSMAVALRYIHSDRSTPTQGDGSRTGNAFAADVAGYVHKYVMLGNAEALWTLGFNVKNIGTKISFGDGSRSSFIPTQLGLGTGLLYPVDEYNTLAFNVETFKLLVPTYPHRKEGMTDAEFEQKREDYNKTGSIAGIFKSFGDAPDGFKEELKEFNLALGAEYSYDNRFFVRAGYHYQSPEKGNLSYFTAGAGFKMSVFRIDASYLVSTVAQNPLDQTLRFTLAFDMDGIRNLFQ